MNHIPSHIYDDVYADYASSLLGRYRPALAAANKIRSIVTEDILTMKDRPKLVTMSDGYYAMKMHVLVRFGRWHEIIAEPPPGGPEVYRLSTPMHHYARGIGYATLKDPTAADRERALFRDTMALLPADLKFLSNLARTTLSAGEAMLDGEIEYHRGNYDHAFAHLREAVHRDDSLNYTPGPGCTRHATRWARY